MTFVGTVIVAGLVFGLLGVAAMLKENVDNYEKEYRARLSLEIYLRDDTTPQELQALIDSVKSLTGYQAFRFRGKAEAYNRMQQSLGVQILPNNGFNPFPNAVSVSLAPQFAGYPSFARAESDLHRVRCVEEINYGKSQLMAQERLFVSLKRLTLILEIVTLLAAVAVVFWGIRKMALSRRQETRILKLFGAGWKQIGIKTVAEGSLLGTAAAAIGVAVSYLFCLIAPAMPMQLVFVSMAVSITIGLVGLIAGMSAGLLVARSQLK